jgi:putative transposase
LWLLDESGLLMAPLLRRSWSPKGRPPQSEEKAGHREKVSVAAALWLTPGRDRLGLAFQTLVNGYFDNEAVADSWRAALTGCAAPVIAIWDGGTMHRGGPINDLVVECGGRLEFEPLPPHAPELMPVEQLWTWLKYSRLCNFAPADARQLDARVFRELDAIRHDQELLRSFFHASDLPLPRALLS